jgi:hypothetical protein
VAGLLKTDLLLRPDYIILAGARIAWIAATPGRWLCSGRAPDISRCHFLTANTHTTPPCGTLFSKPGTLPANAS